MSEEQLKQLDTTSDELIQSLEKVEQEIDNLEGDLEREKQMKHLARLIYEGQLIEQGRLMYSFNNQSYCQILTATKRKL